MADKTKVFTKSGSKSRRSANRRKKAGQRSEGQAAYTENTAVDIATVDIAIRTASGTIVRYKADGATSKKPKHPAIQAYIDRIARRMNSIGGKNTAKSATKESTQKNSKLDLSNITIINSAQPSRESEIIHQFYTLRNYREFGKKKEDFAAAYERELIERYEQLDKEKQDSAFEELEKEFYAL